VLDYGCFLTQINLYNGLKAIAVVQAGSIYSRPGFHIIGLVTQKLPVKEPEPVFSKSSVLQQCVCDLAHFKYGLSSKVNRV